VLTIPSRLIVKGTCFCCFIVFDQRDSETLSLNCQQLVEFPSSFSEAILYWDQFFVLAPWTGTWLQLECHLKSKLSQLHISKAKSWFELFPSHWISPLKTTASALHQQIDTAIWPSGFGTHAQHVKGENERLSPWNTSIQCCVPSAKIPKDLKFANYDLVWLMPRSLMHWWNHFKTFPKTHPKTATLARTQYHTWQLGFWVLGSNPMVGIPNDLRILLIRG
jgi:hypothetical protein